MPFVNDSTVTFQRYLAENGPLDYQKALTIFASMIEPGKALRRFLKKNSAGKTPEYEDQIRAGQRLVAYERVWDMRKRKTLFTYEENGRTYLANRAQMAAREQT